MTGLGKNDAWALLPFSRRPEGVGHVHDFRNRLRRVEVCDHRLLIAKGNVSFPQKLPCKGILPRERPQEFHRLLVFTGAKQRLRVPNGLRVLNHVSPYPHTAKIIWAGHRIIYIFTEASGKITLYYDIELREPLEEKTASGAMFPTTTLVLKNRIYVPVPPLLHSAFKIVGGAKEFFVRFDTIVSI